MAGAEGGSLYRMRGFASGLNWRATRFAEDVTHYITCKMCGVLPRRAVLLPCQHPLCEPCHGNILKDGRGVCAFDGEDFEEHECQRVYISARKAGDLQAHCWNEKNGCSFVGALQDVLQHFEEECSFHEVTCLRCGTSVLNGELPTHWLTGCSHTNHLETSDQHPRHGSSVNRRDVSAKLRQITPPFEEPLTGLGAQEVIIPSLQTKVNDLLEQTRAHEVRLKEVGTVLAAILETLNAEVSQAVGKSSAILDEAQQRGSTSAQQEYCGINSKSAVAELGSNEAAVQQSQEITQNAQNLEGTVSAMVGYLEDLLERARLQLGLLAYPSVTMQQLKRSLKLNLLNRTGKKRLHFLLTVHRVGRLLYECNGSTVSAAVKSCFQLQVCFLVRVGFVGSNWDRLELWFMSSNSCEVHSLTKAMTVTMRLGQSQYTLPEEKGAGLVSASGCRRMFYINEFEGKLKNYLVCDDLHFDILIEE